MIDVAAWPSLRAVFFSATAPRWGIVSQAGLTSQLPPGSRIQGLQGLNCGCGRCGLCKVPAAKLAAVAGASETPRSSEGRGSIDPHPGSESSRAPRIAHQWTERSRPHRVYWKHRTVRIMCMICEAYISPMWHHLLSSIRTYQDKNHQWIS